MRPRPNIVRLVGGLLALVGLGCAGGAGCREEPAGPPSVVLTGRDARPIPIQVEVVTRPAEQARGLMNRDRLAPEAGMLFVYPAEDHRTFWMKNTFIPLDMIFIGRNRRIVGIVHQAEPLTTTPRAVEGQSMFVLEVNGGFTKHRGVKVGSQVRFENIPGLGE